MSTQKTQKKASSEPSTRSSSPATLSSLSRSSATNRSSATTVSRVTSRAQKSSDSTTSSGSGTKLSQRPASMPTPALKRSEEMPKPEYSHQEFSAWKQYMGNGTAADEKPDDKFITWKKKALGEAVVDMVGKKVT